MSPALKARDYKGPSSDGDGDGAPLIAHSLRAEGFDASEDGTGRGTPLVPVAGPLSVDLQNVALGGDVAGTIDTSRPGRGGGQAVLAPIAFDTTQITHPENRSKREPGNLAAMARGAHPPAIAFHLTQDPINGPQVPALGCSSGGQGVAGGVRRLTPTECEKLQGFEPGYTAISGAADGPRYRALGNSMAVSVMRWIGERIVPGEVPHG